MLKLTRLRFNDPAPDLEIQAATGEMVRLSALWAEKPLLLIFTRHFGCPQCKEMLDFVAQNKTELEKAGLMIAVVTQGKPAEALEFCHQHAPGLLCLADPERQAYRAYGVGRAGLSQTFLSWRVWLANWRAGKKGYKTELPPPGQDAMQMSGIFIVGTDGRVRLPYYYDHIADHPVANLLLTGVLATGWNAPFDAPLVSRK